MDEASEVPDLESFCSWCRRVDHEGGPCGFLDGKPVEHRIPCNLCIEDEEYHSFFECPFVTLGPRAVASSIRLRNRDATKEERARLVHGLESGIPAIWPCQWCPASVPDHIVAQCANIRRSPVWTWRVMRAAMKVLQAEASALIDDPSFVLPDDVMDS